MFPPGYADSPTLDESISPDRVHPLWVAYDSSPVIFGHYWLPPAMKAVQNASIACVDSSVASNWGYLAAYTWRGEQALAE